MKFIIALIASLLAATLHSQVVVSPSALITITSGGNNRTLALNGNPTLDDWFNQPVKSTSSPTFVGATFSGAVSGITTLSTTGITNLGGGTAYATGATIKSASNDYQLTLLQSNADSAGWGAFADTGGNLNLSRYGGSEYNTPALVFDLTGIATFKPAGSTAAVISSTGLAVTGHVSASGGLFGDSASIGPNPTPVMNLRHGTAFLPNNPGWVTVNDSTITANTIIILTVQASSGFVPNLQVVDRSAGSYFRIGCAGATADATIGYLLIEP